MNLLQVAVLHQCDMTCYFCLQAVIFNEPYLEPLWAGFTPGGKLWRL